MSKDNEKGVGELGIDLSKIKEKRTMLIGNFNSLQDKKADLEKQMELVNNDMLTIRGAIFLCNEWIGEDESNVDAEKSTTE